MYKLRKPGSVKQLKTEMLLQSKRDVALPPSKYLEKILISQSLDHDSHYLRK